MGPSAGPQQCGISTVAVRKKEKNEPQSDAK